MAQFAVQLAKGETVYVDEADAYQFEGPLTTFFSTGSSRQVIDSWSTRVASYRTADVLSIERFDLVLPMEHGVEEALPGFEAVELSDFGRPETDAVIDIRTSEGLTLIAS